MSVRLMTNALQTKWSAPGCAARIFALTFCWSAN